MDVFSPSGVGEGLFNSFLNPKISTPEEVPSTTPSTVGSGVTVFLGVGEGVLVGVTVGEGVELEVGVGVFVGLGVGEGVGDGVGVDTSMFTGLELILPSVSTFRIRINKFLIPGVTSTSNLAFTVAEAVPSELEINSGILDQAPFQSSQSEAFSLQVLTS